MRYIRPTLKVIKDVVNASKRLRHVLERYKGPNHRKTLKYCLKVARLQDKLGVECHDYNLGTTDERDGIFSASVDMPPVPSVKIGLSLAEHRVLGQCLKDYRKALSNYHGHHERAVLRDILLGRDHDQLVSDLHDQAFDEYYTGSNGIALDDIYYTYEKSE